MAVTVTDRRTTLDQADATTNWTGTALGTTTGDIAEGSAAVTDTINIGTGDTFFNTSAIDLSDSLVYVWSFNNALQPAWNAAGGGGRQLYLSDGTNTIAFHMAGSDRDVFKHLDGPVSWQALVLDGTLTSQKNTDSEVTVIAGTVASLNEASITDVGCRFITLSKALGGGYNLGVDIIRYGNDGLRITAGGSGTEGKFSEIAAADRSTADGAGHGILRQLQPTVFGCQGALTFGDSGTATACYFEETDKVLVFEDWDVADGRYYLNVEGHVTPVNSFVLTGCTIQTAGPNVSIDMSGGNIDTLTLTGCVFSALASTIDFSANADATGHAVTGCTFDGCGQIDPGDVTFEINTIRNSTAGASGAVLLDADGTTNWLDLVFTGITPGGGHGVEITATGTYGFVGHTFTGYGPALIEFDSTSATVVNATLDQLDLPADHGYTTEDPVYYQDQGGTGIGLTDGGLYYVRAVDANSISFHTSAANATSDTARVALTTGTGTQEVASADAAIYNNSAGSVTINVSGGGSSPSVRNADGADTTVNSTIDWTFKMVDDAGGAAVTGAEITVTDTSATPVVLFHVETSATGTETYQFAAADAGNDIIVLVIKDGTNAKEPFQLDTTLPAADATITLPLRDDRVEFNPV